MPKEIKVDINAILPFLPSETAIEMLKNIVKEDYDVTPFFENHFLPYIFGNLDVEVGNKLVEAAIDQSIDTSLLLEASANPLIDKRFLSYIVDLAIADKVTDEQLLYNIVPYIAPSEVDKVYRYLNRIDDFASL